VVDPILSVLFPPRCVGCGDFETYLCPACRASLRPAGDSCARCGEPGFQALVAGRCSACMGKEFEYAGARSAYLHEGPAKWLVAEFKFGGQPILGSLMADLARPEFMRYVSSLTPGSRSLVTWVAAHRKAQRERGYNQAELLARALVGPPGLACAPLVEKKLATRHQKGLGKAGRQGNLRGAFTLREGAAALVAADGYERVLLVDDVYTTGATAAEVGRVIAAGTGLPVYVFTFSRATSSGGVGHD
jgi:predicted amidophosphoribosyltransferase